VSKFTTDYTD